MNTRKITVQFSLALLLAAASLQGIAQNVRIVQTNSRTDTLHLIDPATQSIVAEIKGIPVNHGVAAAPDGSRLYVSSEAKFTLDIVDMGNLAIIAEVPLSGRPNNVAIGKDGRFVYVGIMQDPGGVDVVDTTMLEKVRHIDTGARVHNVYVTLDGKHLVLSMFTGANNLAVYSTETEQLEFSMYPPRDDTDLEGIRPIAFETNLDGSTKRMFVQITDLHGFAVVDFATHTQTQVIALPEIPEAERDPGPFTRAPSHGLGVAPDGKTLLVTSRVNSRAYAYSLPDLQLLGDVRVGAHPDWVTFTPDSRFAYVANGNSNDVSVIDMAALKEVVRLPVGEAPKRNITAILR
jgi:YVTN family beta-propeller protein